VDDGKIPAVIISAAAQRMADCRELKNFPCSNIGDSLLLLINHMAKFSSAGSAWHTARPTVEYDQFAI